MKRILYCVWQCTWGFFQSALGLMVFILHLREKHAWYHGALVTEWKARSSVSLGMFVFLAKEPPFYESRDTQRAPRERAQRLLVHEYGHTVQSLILGPLYLLVIGIPSALWAGLPALRRKRRAENLSYFSFFPERWADRLGEKVLGEALPKTP